MPNWCWNTLKLNKKDADLVLNEKGEVDFNLICPMPESLNVIEGSITKIAIEAYKNHTGADLEQELKYEKDIANFGKEKYSSVTQYMVDHCPTLYELGKTYVLNELNYGAYTWYEWCNKNWGTKWNAGDSDVSKEAGDTWYIHFDTAWCPPEGWLRRLAELEVNFELTWEEESGYAGTITYDRMKGWSEEEHEIEWEEEE